MQFQKLHDLSVSWGRQCSPGRRSDGSAQQSQLCGIRGLGCWFPCMSLRCLLLQCHWSCLWSSPMCPWSLSSVSSVFLLVSNSTLHSIYTSPQVPIPTYPSKSLSPCVSPGDSPQHVSPSTSPHGSPKVPFLDVCPVPHNTPTS